MSVAYIKTESGWEPFVQGAAGADGAPGPEGLPGVSLIVPFSVGGLIGATTYTMRLYVDRDCTITGVRASVGSSPTGSSIIVDVLKNGTTIFTGGTDRPTITVGGNTDTGTPAVTDLVAGDYLTVTVVQVGSTYAGADLVVQVVTN